VKYRQLEAVVDKVHPAVMVIDCETRFAALQRAAGGLETAAGLALGCVGT
jgi:hypothetical protein